MKERVIGSWEIERDRRVIMVRHRDEDEGKIERGLGG